MDFSRARTKEQMRYRKDDIINACKNLWKEEGFDGVNIKRISEITSISRSSIYNYYKTREEIFLEILEEEMRIWQKQLQQLCENNRTLEKTEFSREMTKILMQREQMLQLYSVLFTLIEPNCSLEKLVQFKIVATEVMDTLKVTISAIFPFYSAQKVEVIISEFLCYVLGLYPMTHLTEVQKEAIRISETEYMEPQFEIMCQIGIECFLD